METFFAFGTLWFWVLATIFLIYLIFCIEGDEDYGGTGATVGLAIFLGLLYFMGNKSGFHGFFDYAKDHPGVVIGCIASYFVLGTVWSIVKWFFYLKKEKKLRGSEDFQYKVLHGYYTLSEKTGKIISWMSYWPFSFAWTFFDEPVKKAFETIAERLEGVYNRIAIKISKD
jgi:hypothetical protein